MKLAPLTLLFVCAAPARADAAVPAAGGWYARCAARINQAAQSVGLPPDASVEQPQTVIQRSPRVAMWVVEYTTFVPPMSERPSSVHIEVIENPYPPVNSDWAHRGLQPQPPFMIWRRTLNRRLVRLATDHREWDAPFKAALDDCLTMGASP